MTIGNQTFYSKPEKLNRIKYKRVIKRVLCHLKLCSINRNLSARLYKSLLNASRKTDMQDTEHYEAYVMLKIYNIMKQFKIFTYFINATDSHILNFQTLFEILLCEILTSFVSS